MDVNKLLLLPTKVYSTDTLGKEKFDFYISALTEKLAKFDKQYDDRTISLTASHYLFNNTSLIQISSLFAVITDIHDVGDTLLFLNFDRFKDGIETITIINLNGYLKSRIAKFNQVFYDLHEKVVTAKTTYMIEDEDVFDWLVDYSEWIAINKNITKKII
jgi:hypothetical protein